MFSGKAKSILPVSLFRGSKTLKEYNYLCGGVSQEVAAAKEKTNEKITDASKENEEEFVIIEVIMFLSTDEPRNRLEAYLENLISGHFDISACP